ncbi:hypothetical protein U5801_27005 [Lamprobacter modestohalophilus]|uniref:hypothetical protein n=1 Tax=Lamprobacter modestohalophilus TaxID=1064514 RepID=UPI002ADEADCC|nr:hypothetical protein [Lamprobacter modestohalophilus]MEA1053425.1 hypothetical protein [Lamprobacter modestohalophilus]
MDFQQTFGVYRHLNLDLFPDEQFAYARQHEDALKQTLRAFVVSDAALNLMLGFCAALDLDHDAIPELAYERTEASQQVVAMLLYGVAGLIQQQADTSDVALLDDPALRRRCLLNSCKLIADDHQPEIDILTLEDKRHLGVELIGLASITGIVSDTAQALIVEIGNRLEVDLLSVMEAMDIKRHRVDRHDPRPEWMEARRQALVLQCSRRDRLGQTPSVIARGVQAALGTQRTRSASVRSPSLPPANL